MIDLQVVAFPDGLLRDPGAEDLVAEAVGLGADVVGGIPWIEHTDAEAREHVRRMCRLAAAHGKRVAMLVDDAGDPALRTTEMLAEAMLEHGLVGRGVANHARVVGLDPRPTLERLAGLVKRAGLGFVSDPHTGPLHVPVRELTALGVPVALGQDDIEDAYYPFGRHNLAEVAFLAAHALNAVDTAGIDLVYDAVTTTAARVLGWPAPARRGRQRRPGCPSAGHAALGAGAPRGAGLRGRLGQAGRELDLGHRAPSRVTVGPETVQAAMKGRYSTRECRRTTNHWLR